MVQEKGAFRAFFSASSEPFLSLALPREPTDAWDASIPALVAAFAERSVPLRLEVFAELYPTLGPALARAGFNLDDTAPVMVLEDATFSPVTPDADYLPLPAEKGILEPFLYAQSEAYGGLGDGALGWLPQLTAGLKEGHIIGAALQQNGELVAGATILLGGDVGELAGVWTKASWRRQGLARRVCRPLLSAFFRRGQTCWLSAAPGAEGLYRQLGFSEVGTQLNYSRSSRSVQTGFE